MRMPLTSRKTTAESSPARSFRADVWTVLERSPGLSVADVARRAACSFATAWQAVQDFRLLRAAHAR